MDDEPLGEEAIDMSLDDIMEMRRRRRAQYASFRSRGGYSFPSAYRPIRRLPGEVRAGAAPYSCPPVMSRLRGRPTIQGGSSGSSPSTKLFVSNLHSGVTDKDIMFLFTVCGELRHYGIHYDIHGISQGTAEVVYEQHSDAMTAIRRFNNVPLDGVPINIELVESAAPAVLQAAQNFRRRPLSRVSSRRSFGHRRARGTQRNREHSETITAETLDGDLAEYFYN